MFHNGCKLHQTLLIILTHRKSERFTMVPYQLSAINHCISLFRSRLRWNLILCISSLYNFYLYIYKVGAFFDLLGRTPPRPLAFEGWNLDKLLYWPCRWLWLSQFWSSAIYRCHLLAIFTLFLAAKRSARSASILQSTRRCFGAISRIFYTTKKIF